jgi:hypothetical protein
VKKNLYVVQLELLLKGQGNLLAQCLQRSPEQHPNRYASRLLKAIREYQVLLQMSAKSTGPQTIVPLPPVWEKLRLTLESRQQLMVGERLLQKNRGGAGKAVFIWVEEQFKQRTKGIDTGIINLRRSLVKHRGQVKLPPMELESLTDSTLWRQQVIRLGKVRRQMQQAISRIAKRKSTADTVRPLRDLLRAYRDHLDCTGRIFEIPWPCDPKLIADYQGRIKRIDRWHALDEWLTELEPQTTRMPRKMFEEWQEFRAFVREKSERRLKKLRKALARDGIEWAGLQFTLTRN